MNTADHECTNTERLLKLEKEVVQVQTSTQYLYEDINELKTAIKECTQALNDLSNKISIEESHTNTSQWYVMLLIAIAGVVIGYIL